MLWATIPGPLGRGSAPASKGVRVPARHLRVGRAATAVQTGFLARLGRRVDAYRRRQR